jgi:hypothetical protein
VVQTVKARICAQFLPLIGRELSMDVSRDLTMAGLTVSLLLKPGIVSWLDLRALIKTMTVMKFYPCQQ